MLLSLSINQCKQLGSSQLADLLRQHAAKHQNVSNNMPSFSVCRHHQSASRMNSQQSNHTTRHLMSLHGHSLYAAAFEEAVADVHKALRCLLRLPHRRLQHAALIEALHCRGTDTQQTAHAALT
jgi:hypothetical protein